MTETKPQVDGRGFCYLDGVMIGRLVCGPDGQPRLQVCDKNKHRSHQRGTRFVETSIQQLSDVAKKGGTDADMEE